MRIIYMGTPDFAVGALEALCHAGHEVIACFTQPDKPKGRGKTMMPTPVKEKAMELGIPVYQPARLRDKENTDIIAELKPDAIVVAAYGQILPESILKLPPYGCINIHASLLPKYRGAAPVEWAIIDGEQETGVTTMFMEKGLDTGDMLEKTVVPIAPEDTGVTLHDKLAKAGALLIVETLAKLQENSLVRIPQRDEDSNYAVMLKKEMGNLDFSMDALKLERLIRGLQPWPCAYTDICKKTVKIYEADVVALTDDEKKKLNLKYAGRQLAAGTDEMKQRQLAFVPGEIIDVTKKSFTICCGTSNQMGLVIKKLQPEGKKVMDSAAFLAGNKLEIGQLL